MRASAPAEAAAVRRKNRKRVQPPQAGPFPFPLTKNEIDFASVFTLNLAAGRGALLHCFCAVPEDWQTLELTWHPDFAAGRSAIFTVRRDTDEADLGPVPTTPAEVGSRR